MAGGFTNSNATVDCDVKPNASKGFTNSDTTVECSAPSNASGFGDGASLNDTGVIPGHYAPAGITVNSKGQITNAVNVPYGVPPGGDEGEALVKNSKNDFDTKWSPAVGLGSVTRIEGESPENTIAIGGLPITSTGTMLLDLTNTGVIAGDYGPKSIVTVDYKGRITNIANNTTVDTIHAFGDATGVSNAAGYLPLTLANTSVVAGVYTLTNLTIDSKGRILAASNGGGFGVGSVTSVAIAGGSPAITVAGFSDHNGWHDYD